MNETNSIRCGDDRYEVKRDGRTIGFVSRTILPSGEKRFIGAPLCQPPAMFGMYQSALKYIETVHA